MTIIACSAIDKCLIADTQLTSSGLRDIYMQKIHRAPDGSLFGVAGCAKNIARIIPWMHSGAHPDNLVVTAFENAECVRLMPDGGILYYEGPAPVTLLDKVVFIGSGYAVAKAAYTAGATLRRAV